MDIDRIKALDIVDVADSLDIEYKRKGSKLWAHCLWHDDKNPSMVIGGRKNLCHCFGCGETADAIKLVMKAKGMSFVEACEWMGGGPEPLPQASPPALSSREGAAPLTPKWGSEYSDKRTGKDGKTDAPSSTVTVPVVEVIEPCVSNSFSQCMTTVFGDEAARRVTEEYKLGRWNTDDVAFQNIDGNGVVRGVKIQGYCANPKSEKFFHRNKTCYWLPPPPSGSLPTGEGGGRGRLFGEHLLVLRPDAIVILVESPKNACVGAAAYPQYVWVAVGNKNMLKREVLMALKDRRVVVFPDADAVDEWSEKLTDMSDIATFVVAPPPEANGKSDIADWIIKNQLK